MIVLEECNDALSAALLRLGALVLVSDDSQTGVFVETGEGLMQTATESLPFDDMEAAHTLKESLERAKVLLPSGSWSGSGRI